MNVEEYLAQGAELKKQGHYTDGCSFVGRFVPDKYVPACWSHDYARNGFINLSHSENDNMFRNALRHLGMNKFWSNVMYYFTKTQGWFKEKFNMSGNAFAGFLFFILIVVLMFWGASAQADQRCDMDTQNCHISLDPDDDDTEIDYPAAKMTSAGISRTLVDGVRTADGWFIGYIYVPMETVRSHDFLNEGQNVYRKGSDSLAANLPYVIANNTACNLTRTNFQENTGSDDQNQTEYTTNDWELSMHWFNKMGGKFGEYGIWHVALYCTGAQ